MLYGEDDYLSLSGIQHFMFCRRQWALIHIEQQWEDNLRTVEGLLMHKNAHDSLKTETRGDIIITRGMPVFSKELGVYGVCDVVEFHRSDDGISLFGRDGKYLPCPIEYKKGRPKEDPDLIVSGMVCVWKCCAVQLNRRICIMVKHA